MRINGDLIKPIFTILNTKITLKSRPKLLLYHNINNNYVIKMNHTLGERLNIHFNSKIRIEFHGARLTSDGGLLAYRELDAASR